MGTPDTALRLDGTDPLGSHLDYFGLDYFSRGRSERDSAKHAPDFAHANICLAGCGRLKAQRKPVPPRRAARIRHNWRTNGEDSLVGYDYSPLRISLSETESVMSREARDETGFSRKKNAHP
jgi:hypothetical protein